MRAARAALGCAALAALVAVGGGCALARWPAREIVWQGEQVVRGTLVVAAGERLVIRPGTRVLFAFVDENGDGAGDSRIVAKGSVIARGTAAAPIEFAPQKPDGAGAAGWDAVLIEDAAQAQFTYCRFVGAQQAIHAHRTPLTVEDSRLEGNGIGIRFTGGPVAIRRSRFVSNGTAIRYFESSPEVVGNEFERNATALFIREGSARSVVTGNNFVSSSDYHVKLGEAQAADVDARGNWWGTDRREEIERLVYDREDAAYLGRVLYEPPAPAPWPVQAP
jgi:nitrous oxidase accessory protein NosD